VRTDTGLRRCSSSDGVEGVLARSGGHPCPRSPGLLWILRHVGGKPFVYQIDKRSDDGEALDVGQNDVKSVVGGCTRRGKRSRSDVALRS
jgi:hypothetical protein